MSLEISIQELTAAVKALHTAITTVAEMGGELPAATTKRTRKTADAAPVATAATPAPQVTNAPVSAPVIVSAPVAAQRTFWHVPAHNTVYVQEVGAAHTEVAGQVQIDEATYNVLRAQYAQQTAAVIAQPAAVPQVAAVTQAAPAAAQAQAAVQQQAVATSAPPATVVAAASTGPVTPADVTAKFQALVKTPGKGAGAMAKVLQHFGAANISALTQKVADLSDVIAQIDMELASA